MGYAVWQKDPGSGVEERLDGGSRPLPSREKRRFGPIQAKKRSTPHRRLWTLNPIWSSLWRTIWTAMQVALVTRPPASAASANTRPTKGNGVNFKQGTTGN